MTHIHHIPQQILLPAIFTYFSALLLIMISFPVSAAVWLLSIAYFVDMFYRIITQVSGLSTTILKNYSTLYLSFLKSGKCSSSFALQKKLAGRYKIPSSGQALMSAAFSECERDFFG
jgi:hypothetical protein